MQFITARMQEEFSELRNEMIEMKSKKIACETRNTSGSTKTLEVSSRRIGMKELNLSVNYSMQQKEVAKSKKTQQAVAKSIKTARRLNLGKEKV